MVRAASELRLAHLGPISLEGRVDIRETLGGLGKRKLDVVPRDFEPIHILLVMANVDSSQHRASLAALIRLRKSDQSRSRAISGDAGAGRSPVARFLRKSARFGANRTAMFGGAKIERYAGPFVGLGGGDSSSSSASEDDGVESPAFADWTLFRRLSTFFSWPAQKGAPRESMMQDTVNPTSQRRPIRIQSPRVCSLGVTSPEVQCD